jgi:hypothetical protein
LTDLSQFGAENVRQNFNAHAKFKESTNAAKVLFDPVLRRRGTNWKSRQTGWKSFRRHSSSWKRGTVKIVKVGVLATTGDISQLAEPDNFPDVNATNVTVDDSTPLVEAEPVLAEHYMGLMAISCSRKFRPEANANVRSASKIPAS